MYKGIFDKYIIDPNPQHWIDTRNEDNDFANFMWNLGFEMDCENSFNEWVKKQETKYRDVLDALDNALTQIVGNYIFSYFRYLTHWSMGYSIDRCKDFFPKALKILERKLIEDGIERKPFRK